MAKGLKFILLLFFLAIPSLGLEIATNAKLIDGVYYVVQGERVEIKILGEPSQEVGVLLNYRFSVPSSEGFFRYSQSKFQIPISSEFEVSAYPVQNITVEAKFWIFSKKLEASAVNDVAKVSASVPEGKYDVSIYGLAKGSAVSIEAKARARIKLDSSGVYSISYDTSRLPLGDMEAVADSKQLKVKVVSSLPSSEPTPTPTPALKPDLLIASMDYSPKQLIAGQQASIKVAVSNAGNADAAAFNVSLLINESKIAEQRVSGLKAGESKTLAFAWTPASAGSYTLMAIADSNGEIDESDEENNGMSVTIEIVSPTTPAPKQNQGPIAGGGGGGYVEETVAYFFPSAAVAANRSREYLMPEGVAIETGILAVIVKPEDSTDIGVSVERLKNLPPEIPRPEGMIAAWSISLKLGSKTNVSGKIKFLLSQDEIGLNPNSVVLMKWDGSWIELSTRFVGSDGKYSYYEAEVMNFSYFAAIKKPEMETAIGTPEAPKEERIPRIYLNRTSAYPLEEIEVSGENFSGNVILKICGNECHEAANCSCFNGSFVCTLKLPKIAGNYSLIAEDSFGARAEERIRVVERERGIPGFEALTALIALILASRRFR